jgi:hypothetical protein
MIVVDSPAPAVAPPHRPQPAAVLFAEMKGRAVGLPALVAEMPHEEWSAALCASDMPTRRGEFSPEQVAAWIVQGTERMGGEVAVWWHHKQTLHALGDDTAAGDAEWRRLWPNRQRQRTAEDLMWKLHAFLRGEGVRPLFPTVLVPFCVDELGRTWSTQERVRDLEMRERRGAQLAEQERRAA